MSRTGINQRLTAESFVSRWSGREGGQERANYSLFLTELCDVLGCRIPTPLKHRTNITIMFLNVVSSDVNQMAQLVPVGSTFTSVTTSSLRPSKAG